MITKARAASVRALDAPRRPFADAMMKRNVPAGEVVGATLEPSAWRTQRPPDAAGIERAVARLHEV